mmetsp:Transcript_17028/g.26307  ORF Transcript_17028/g.26307 Transcript_17028/m.26307 type:complete len:182 (+) Transcript_17028:982-1527(+)
MSDLQNIELQKSILQYHSSFNANLLFREIDTENKGFINAESLAAYFSNEADMQQIQFSNIINFWNGGKRDDRLMISDFEKGVLPYGSGKPSFESGYGSMRRAGGYGSCGGAGGFGGGFGGSYGREASAGFMGSRIDEDQKEFVEEKWRKQVKLILLLTDGFLQPEMNEEGEIIGAMTHEEA